ncbi:MAG TPA: glycosyltransferase, partial [Acidimicrobiales bacterium]|nr:glycosyltransferase [Acidimicrobiales bacterium]
MRLALVALTTTGAAGDYVSALGDALARRATVAMWVPDRPPLAPTTETHVIEKPPSRVGVARAEAIAAFRSSTLAERVASWDPDLVHIVYGEGYPSAARAAAALASRQIPVVATWHDPRSHG